MRFFFFLLLLGFPLAAPAQNLLLNGSFEGPDGHSVAVEEWVVLGESEEPAPDVHTNISSLFGVEEAAVAGDNFLGMVMREDGSFESLGQHLDQALAADATYTLSVWLARSARFRAGSVLTRRTASYRYPPVFVVYGSLDFEGSERELLARSEPFEEFDWQELTFEFTPSEDWPVLIIAVEHPSEAERLDIGGGGRYFNGHLLLDDLRLYSAEDSKD